MNMPVIAATRLKGYVSQKNGGSARLRQGLQIRAPCEIPGICIVGRANAKLILLLHRSFAYNFHTEFLPIQGNLRSIFRNNLILATSHENVQYLFIITNYAQNAFLIVIHNLSCRLNNVMLK